MQKSVLIKQGALVISQKGHDAGSVYVILNAIDANFVWVSNGSNRGIGKPKKKRIKHLFITNLICDNITDNSKIVFFINKYKKTNKNFV